MLQQEIESLVMEGKFSEKESNEENIEPLSDADVIEGESEAGKILNESQPKNEIEDVQTKIEKMALNNVKASIIIHTIGQKEGINVTDDEVNERISFIANRLLTSPEAIKSFYQYREGSLESIRRSIYEEKVLDMLLSKAILEREETA